MSEAGVSGASESEIELKLLTAPGGAKGLWALPAVKALLSKPSRTRRVRTVYHDTPEADLMRAGCALRVREVDGKFEQHLKTAGSVEGGLFKRHEWRSPLASATPDPPSLPPEAAELLAPFAAALRPVFETDVERTDAVLSNGVFAVEIAADDGWVRAFDAAGRVARETPLCEIELEWRSGPAAHVFDLALDISERLPLVVGWQSKAERGYALALALAPSARRAATLALAPDASVSRAAAAILGEGMNHFLANQPYFESHGAVEAVHQMRVACRRLRAALSLFRPVLPPDEIAAFRDGFRDLARALGAVRDIDVLEAHVLAPLIEEPLTPDAVRERLEALRPRLAQRRIENLAKAGDLVQAPETARLLLRLGRRVTLLAADDSAVPFGEFADETLKTRHRKLARRARKLKQQTPEDRHRVRIAAKKVRYAAEFFRARYGEKPMSRYLDALGELQDVLGDLNDIAGIADVLERAVDDARSVRLVAGYAMGWHTRRMRACLDEAEEILHLIRKAQPFESRAKR